MNGITLPTREARDPYSPGMRPGDAPTGSARRITEADIRNVLFHKPPFGKRGYDEAEVDHFLDALADTLAGKPGSRITAESVREAAFRKPPFGKRGYDEDEVDSFLDLVEAELRRLEGGAPPPPPRSAPAALPPGPGRANAAAMPGPQAPGMPGMPGMPRPLDPAAVVRTIWERIENREWHGVAELIDTGFVCEWPESRERFMGRDAWITMNVNYPSNFHITVDDVIGQGERVASRVRVSDENGTFHAMSFWSVQDGRAVHLVEYYVREGSAVPPQWRAQWAQRY